jgi:hypothetical protein
MGLTGTTPTIPSNFSGAKQERMKVAPTFKWAPHKSHHMAPTLEPQNWSKVNIIARDGVWEKAYHRVFLGMQNSHPRQ